MQGIDATFDEVAFLERGPQRILPQFLMIAAAVAAVGCVSAFALRARLSPPPAPAVAIALPALAPFEASVAPAAPPQMTAADFGPMIVEPGWLPAEKPSASATPPTNDNAGGEQSVPPTVTARLPEVIPMPPARDVPEVADSFPMPPPRPTGIEAPTLAGPEPQQPGVAGAPPTDNGNIFQKLLGSLSRPGEPGVAPATRTLAPPVVAPAPVAPPAPAVASVPQDRAGGRAPSPSPLAFFSQKLFGASNPPAGYDRYTAVYDISARVVYMPDGTRLEAHSGLGDRLDDPRYVHERAKGATPPHLYELTMREALFHGVQALRLNPVGDGGIYGRAGLLAHPFMLGPNGDSNGCVSVKDYDAFLRAYENGQIKRLAVVAGL
jgi:hypothetical protein